MSRQSLDDSLASGGPILIDSTVLIAHLNGNEATSSLATHVIDDRVAQGLNTAVVSMVSVLEVLVRPLTQSIDVYEHVHAFLTNHPHMRLADIDLAVAQEAARIRAQYRMATPDALVIATGIVHQVQYLVTSDRRWQRLTAMARGARVVDLGDHTR